MLAKAKPTSRPTNQDNAAAAPKGQQRAAEERYRLRVDGQLKRSFNSKEAAFAAGQVIKKAFPVVMVTVVDAETGATEIAAA